MMTNSVDPPDAGLEATIRGAIGKSEGDIYESDVQRLTNLVALERNISDLTCLEYATGLTERRFGHARIGDISPPANLTNLTWLHLGANQISNILPSVNLTNLTRLELDISQISDISPLV
jgi:internalin A